MSLMMEATDLASKSSKKGASDISAGETDTKE